MTKGDRFWAMMERKRRLHEAEAAGLVADDSATRIALVERVHAGEITLEEAQAELQRIKRNAKANGKTTRARAYSGRS